MPIAHQWYGGYLLAMGRHSEAIAERKRALELEPLSLIINFELGLAFYYARDYDQAIEQFQKDAGIGPELSCRRTRCFPAAYVQKGMYTEAIAGFKKSLPLGTVNGQAQWLVLAMSMRYQVTKARR